MSVGITVPEVPGNRGSLPIRLFSSLLTSNLRKSLRSVIECNEENNLASVRWIGQMQQMRKLVKQVSQPHQDCHQPD